MALSRITNPFLSSSGAGNASITSPAANTVAFTTATTERMRIDSSGNIGIGTASPGYKFDIAGGVSDILRLTNTSASGYEEIKMTVGTQSARIVLTGQSFGDANYGTGDLTIQAQTAGKGIRFGTNGGVNQMILDSAGLLTLASGQIKFPATQNASGDANTLDDYEEGTYSPNLSFQSALSGSFTFTRNTSRYVKIGRLVHIQGWAAWSAKPSAGNTLNMTVPFTMESGDDPRGGIQIAYADGCFTGLTTIYQWAFRTENGGTVLIANYRNDSTTGVMNNSINASNLLSSGGFMFSGTYFTSA
jgi:hypothetical protein